MESQNTSFWSQSAGIINFNKFFEAGNCWDEGILWWREFLVALYCLWHPAETQLVELSTDSINNRNRMCCNSLPPLSLPQFIVTYNCEWCQSTASTRLPCWFTNSPVVMAFLKLASKWSLIIIFDCIANKFIAQSK